MRALTNAGVKTAMTPAASATPLIALDAVVIDTETTALDVRKARVVEIAVVRLTVGQVGETFRRLIQPRVMIPAQATRIHGIDDAAVAGAPRFAEAWGEVAGQFAGHVIIGHVVDFDLAVLRRECARASLPWSDRRTLDTRLLAEIAAPGLASYALEDVAVRLGVDVVDRHSALGDALMAARIFLALLPKLREKGIRTLAEAERASQRLPSALEEPRRAGWLASRRAAAGDDEPAVRIDSYPYRRRVSDVMSPPRIMAADAPLTAALSRMAEERISSVFVRFDAGEQALVPSEAGIVTERDVLRLMAGKGAEALRMSIGEAAKRPLRSVPHDAFAYLAMARMNRLRVRHLGVTDDGGRLVGALSARDLLRLRAEGTVALGDEIEEAAGTHELGHAWAKLPQIVAGLREEGLTGIEIAALISHQLGLLTQRAAVLAEQRMREAGRGEPPCSYALAVLGSAGRGESLLAMDQDNALIFADGVESADADGWFEALGAHVADILHEVGVPYCKGGIMAKNPQWRGSVSTWRKRISQWIERSRPQDLLSVDIFFDMRGVHGDTGLADLLWREAFAAAKGQAAFAKLLVESAGSVEPGLNFFGGFRTAEGRIDVKRTGLFGLVSSARAVAICHHVTERATPARLAGIKALGRNEGDLDALVEAQQVFIELALDQQIEDMARGIPPSNAVEVKRLSSRDRKRLRVALKAVAHLDELTRDLLFKA
jgi:CBS domain-containing protein